MLAMKKILFLLCLVPLLGHGQVITTIAGNGIFSGPLGDGGPGTAARISLTSCVATDPFGNIFIGDPSNNRVRRVDGITGIITTIAGTGIAGYNGDGIPATTAQLNIPTFVSCDTIGNVYIGDGNNFRIRKVDVITGIISTYTGNGIHGYSPDGTLTTAARLLGGPITIDNHNLVYQGDQTHPDTSFIRNTDPTGTLITVAGTAPFYYSGDNGPATAATICVGLQMCTDRHRNLYFVDDLNKAVRRINFATGIITRVAGTADTIGSPYSGEGGPATNAHINPEGIAIDDTGNIYIADALNHRIEKIDTYGIIRTIAGIGTAGFSGDNGPAISAKFNAPRNLALDDCNDLVVADFNNKRVRKISWVHASTIAITGNTVAAVGSAVTLTASITNAGRNYTIKWYNKGVLFNTVVASPNVSYIKTMVFDSITAVVYGCSDSASSGALSVVDGHVSVAEVAGNQCIVYPFPTSSILHVDGVVQQCTYMLCDIAGRQVASGALNTGNNTISVIQLSTGSYVLQLTASNGQRKMLRVQKE